MAVKANMRRVLSGRKAIEYGGPVRMIEIPLPKVTIIYRPIGEGNQERCLCGMDICCYLERCTLALLACH